jgi:hypothetical protein
MLEMIGQNQFSVVDQPSYRQSFGGNRPARGGAQNNGDEEVSYTPARAKKNAQKEILENRARIKIIESLVINREVKKAIRKRIQRATFLAV